MAGETSPLLLALLSGQNPELAAAMPRMSLAQSLMQEGSNTAPVGSPWAGVGRVAQALLGAYMGMKSQDELDAIGTRNRKETAGALGALGGYDSPPASAPAPQASAAPYGGSSASVPAEYMPFYQEASQRTGIPVNVLIAQGKQESGFNPNATGAAGEIGIHQILPSTAQSPGFGMAGVDPASLRDPRANINFGADYLKARAGPRIDFTNPATVEAALKNYNGGGDPNYVQNVMRYAGGVPVVSGGPGVAGRTGGVDVAGPGAPVAPAPVPIGGASGPPLPPPSAASIAGPRTANNAAAALDMMRRAHQVAEAFPNNKVVQDAAKSHIEYAKTLLEQAHQAETAGATRLSHTETLSQSAQQFRDRQAQELQMFKDRQKFDLEQSNRGTLPPGMQRTPEGAERIPGTQAPAPHTITMRDPTGEGNGLYEVAVGADGVGQIGRRLGDAPGAQDPGDILRTLSPLVIAGKATPDQEEKFIQAGDRYSAGGFNPATQQATPGLPFTPRMQEAFDALKARRAAPSTPAPASAPAPAPQAAVAPTGGGPSPAGAANPMDQPPVQQITPTGSIRTAQPPTTTPPALEAYRTAEVESGKVLDAADAFMTELRKQGGTGLATYLNNPRYPEAIRLNALHDRIQEALRGPAFMDTGVLQPAEAVMVREKLLDPRTASGAMAKTESYQAIMDVLKETVNNGLARKRALAGLPPLQEGQGGGQTKAPAPAQPSPADVEAEMRRRGLIK